MDDVIQGDIEANEVILQNKKSFTSNRIAGVVSHIFNPSITGTLFVTSVLFRDISTINEAGKWLLILLPINLIPLGLHTMYLLRNNKIDTLFIKTRQKRTSMYLLSIIMMGISCLLLQFCGAHKAVLVVTTTILLINTLYMCINFFWKISVHAAFTGLAVAGLCISYGIVCAGSLILIPLVSWARIRLGYHSLMQVVAGTALAVVIFIAVAIFFDIV